MTYYVNIIAIVLGLLAICIVLGLGCIGLCLMGVMMGVMMGILQCGFITLFVVSVQDLYETGECCCPLPGGRGQRDLRYIT